MVNTRANKYSQNDPLTRMTEVYGVRKLRKYLKTLNTNSSSVWRSYQNNIQVVRQQLLIERLQRTAEEMEREEEIKRIIERNEELIDSMCAYTPLALSVAMFIFIFIANFDTSILNTYDFQ